MKLISTILAAGFVAAILFGCDTDPRPRESAEVPSDLLQSSLKFQKEYLLVDGDQVEVAVWRTPEVSRTVTIRSDGMISLPLIQDVKAAGLTPRELAESIRNRLSGRLVDPEVAVIPTVVRQPTIYVLGDVRSPGAFPLHNATTAAQAIALAGGSLRTASERAATLIRLSESGQLEAIPLRESPINVRQSPFILMAATPLQADDIVFVPESGRAEVVRAINDLLAPFQIYLQYKILEKVS